MRVSRILFLLVSSLLLLLLLSGTVVQAEELKPSFNFNSPELRKAIAEGPVRIVITVTGENINLEAYIDIQAGAQSVPFSLANLPKNTVLMVQAEARDKTGKLICNPIKALLDRQTGLKFDVDAESTAAAEIAELTVQKAGKGTVYTLSDNTISQIRQEVKKADYKNLDVKTKANMAEVIAANVVIQATDKDVPPGIAKHANLSSITLSSGTLRPGFTPENLIYTVQVENKVDSIKIEAITDYKHASYLLKKNGILVDNPSEPISLDVGNNLITIEVSAKDGRAQKTYAITIRRLSNNANLSGIDLSVGMLSPAFAVDTTSYTATVVNTIEKTIVKPTVEDKNASFVITKNGSSVTNPVSLDEGSNLVVIDVTAEDGTKKTYSIEITRLKAGLTVHVKRPASWTNTPMLYYWGVSPAQAEINWPGNAMLQNRAEGDDWYSYTIVGANSANVIFNNNQAPQTIDLSRNREGWFVPVNSVSGLWNGTWYDSNPDKEVLNLKAIAGDGKVTLTWQELASNIPGYIEITYMPSGSTMQVAKGICTKEIAGLTNGVAYTFTVKMVDNDGNKSKGGTVQVMPEVYEPPYPGYLNDQPDAFEMNDGLAHNSPPYFSWIYPDKADGHIVITWGRVTAHKPTLYLGTSSGNYNIGKYKNTIARKQHSLVCDNLSPDTTYYFKVVDEFGNTIIDETTFKTAPSSTGSFSFVQLSDSQPYGYPNDVSRTTAVAAALANDKTTMDKSTFILHTGDLVADGSSTAEWRSWLSEFYPGILSKKPLMAISGNHDYISNSAATSYLKDIFTFPGQECYYQFDVGKARFICLESGNYNLPGDFSFRPDQAAFIDSSLNQAWQDKQSGKINFIFVAVHYSIGSTGMHANDSIINTCRDTIKDKLRDYGVDFVMTGHDHTAQRNIMNGVTYIVGGTSGGWQETNNGAYYPERAPAGLYNQFFAPDPAQYASGDRAFGYHVYDVSQNEVNVSFKEIDGTIAYTANYRLKTVYYHNPRAWQKVYIDYANAKDRTGALAWTQSPGRRMIDMGNGWYKYTMPVEKDVNGQYTLTCRFNDGSSLQFDNNDGLNYVITEDEKYIEGTNQNIPVISIAFPANNAMVTSSSISVSGTASIAGSDTITKVELSVNGGAYFEVNGMTNWRADNVALAPGQVNTIQARATASNGKIATSEVITVTHSLSKIIIDGVRDAQWDNAFVVTDDGDDAGTVPVAFPEMNLTNVCVTNDSNYLYIGWQLGSSTTLQAMTNWYFMIDKGTTDGASTNPGFGEQSRSNTVTYTGNNLPDIGVFFVGNAVAGVGLDGFYAVAPGGSTLHNWDSTNAVVNIANGWAEARIPIADLGLNLNDSINFWFAISKYDRVNRAFIDTIPRLGAEFPAGGSWSTTAQSLANNYAVYQLK